MHPTCSILVLTSSSEPSAPPREVFYLANDLLDLIVSIESSLGSRYASHVLSVAKPRLPVLVLGLGSDQGESTSSSGDFTALPFDFLFWARVSYMSSANPARSKMKRKAKRQGMTIPSQGKRWLFC